MPTLDAPHVEPSTQAASAEVVASARFLEAFASAVRLVRVATLLTVLMALAAFPRSAFFPIRAITVEGTHQVSDDEVIARSQLHVGEARFTVSATEVAARIMRDPRIDSAQVHLTADGTIRIRVAERVPHAAVRMSGAYYLVDRSGVVLEHRQDPADLSILTVEGTGLARPQLGLPIPSADVLRALDVFQTLPSSVIGPGVHMKVAANGDLTLITGDGIALLLGQPRGLLERVAPLEAVLAAVRRESGATDYIDVRYAGSIVVKPVGKGPRAGVRP